MYHASVGLDSWYDSCRFAVQVLWLLLTLHKPLLCTACRITEVYSLCLQQSTEWPTVSAYLLSAKRMALPDRVTQHLQNVVQCEQPAEKGSAEWHLGTERTAIMLVGVSYECHLFTCMVCLCMQPLCMHSTLPSPGVLCCAYYCTCRQCCCLCLGCCVGSTTSHAGKHCFSSV